MEESPRQVALRCQVTLRIYGKEKCFGPGVAELLEYVEKTGSLRQAALSMEMAYSKAWKMMKTAEENLGFPLLCSTTGGKSGGGARLTDMGERFLRAYRRFEEAVRGYAEEAFVEIMG